MLVYNRIKFLFVYYLIVLKNFYIFMINVYKIFNFGCENENWFIIELYE